MQFLAAFLNNIHPSLGSLGGVPLAVFTLVVLLTTAFLVGYAFKGTQVWWQLRTATRDLRRVSNGASPDEIAAVLRWEPLRHLWQDYRDTLHEVRKASGGGLTLSEVRATVPAETMFTREVLVDGRLFDDFTRHLPGVLTGLGIIGTFAGLLQGLSTFDATSSATAVAGLKPLMAGVQHAFVASGIAIACAMGVVFISRLVLAYLYRLVERLTHAIDGLYSGGAGEEYLARLVTASEHNEAHLAQLKDALVEDLTKMMTNLVDRQIAAHDMASRALGDQVGKTIAEAVAGPMKQFGDAIDRTTTGNGEQVSNMLETLLTGFMAKLEDTFGGQMRGINEQMQKSIDAMAAVQTSLQTLLADVKSTNEQAANAMSGKLEEAMQRSTENQQVLTEQMRQFVQDFRNLVAEEQAKSTRAMDDAVTKVLEEVARSMNQLERTRETAAAEEAGRNEKLANQTTTLVTGLTTRVEEVLAAITEQVNKTQQNVDALRDVSVRAIDGMNSGALTISSAAEKFATAGNSVSAVLERSGKVSEQMAAATTSLQAAASAVQRGFEQYDVTRKTVDAHVASLTGLIEAARKEAGVSKDLIESIRTSARHLQEAEAQGRLHLEQVNEALRKAFDTFGNALVEAVKKTIAETDRHLSAGTGHLNGVVQEFASAVRHLKRS